MAEEFSKRTVAQGCITFSLGCTKKLTSLMHWVQDCFCTNDEPDYLTFNDKQLAEAQSHALVWKADLDLVDTNTKAADPSKFKEECKWPEWSKAFMNYLSIIPGVNGIPLSYIVHESEPEGRAICDSFNEHMIARAPHVGQYYKVDSHWVHTLLTRYLQGKLMENWIHPLAHYQDGHHDMQALWNHYASEGNSTHCIADAKHIQAALHYKIEHALPSNKFLDSLQKMFTIFQEEGKPLTECAKVDELLMKVQHPALTAAIAQLDFQLNTEGVTFTVAANHLNSAMSQTPDYQMARQIKSTNTSQRGSGNNHFGGHGGGCFNNSG